MTANNNDSSPTMVKVLVVDENETVRTGVTARLRASRRLLIVGIAADIESAWELIESVHPDIAVIDAHLPNNDAIDLIRRIRDFRPDIRSILYIATAVSSTIALDVGAAAVVLKKLTNDRLVDTIETLTGH